MNLLDIRTIVFSYMITNIICTWFVVLLWRQSRERFGGMALLVIDFIFQAAALILIALRGHSPDWISMVFSNTLVIVGALLGFMGLEQFTGKKGAQIQNYLLVLVFIVVQSYFTLAQPNLAARTLNIAVALLLVCAQSVWLMWRRVEPGLRSMTFGVGLVNFFYCMVSVVRIFQFLSGAHTGNNYFRSGLVDALVLLSYQGLFIALTYSLVLMVNKRLLIQIGAQEEKFAKAFHSAPYAVTLTRLPEGTIVDVNETFESMTGYGRTEVLGKKTVELGIWEDGGDRAAVVETLSTTGRVNGVELRFRKKNGESMTGLFSAETILIDGEQNVLSSIGDITERKRVEDALKASEGRFRGLVEQAAVGVAEIVMETGRFITVNARLCEMVGRTQEELLATTFQAITHPEDVHLHEEKTVLLAAGTISHYKLEKRYLRKGGESVWVNLTTSPLWKRGEKPGHSMIVVEDITERRRMEETLRKSEEEQRLLMESLPLAVYIETQGRIAYANPAFLTLFKASSPYAVIGIRLSEFVAPELYDTIVKQRRMMIEEKRIVRPLELTLRCMNGTFVTVVSTPMPIIFQGQPAILTALYDITERKRSEIELEKSIKLLKIHAKNIEDLQTRLKEQTIRDPLTGLFNRRYLEETMARELAMASREGTPISVVMIDIDHFKQVNDIHGHKAGDLILQAMGNLLLGTTRVGDIACRYGGEEFLLILPRASRAIAAERVEELRASFEALRTIYGEQTLQATISLGIASYPADGATAEEVIHAADQAMFRAKAAGRNRVVLS